MRSPSFSDRIYFRMCGPVYQQIYKCKLGVAYLRQSINSQWELKMTFAKKLRALCALSFMVVVTCPGMAQDDVADIHSTQHKLKPETLQYNLISATEKLTPPAAGYKLLIVMPGGDGGADF